MRAQEDSLRPRQRAAMVSSSAGPPSMAASSRSGGTCPGKPGRAADWAHSAALAGYSLIYFGNVVRAGDQIDLDVNPNLLPPEANPFTGPLPNWKRIRPDTNVVMLESRMAAHARS